MEHSGRSFIASPEECPYLGNRTKLYRYCINYSLSQDDLNHLLVQGWRHFGYTFFKPECPGCMLCIPVRVKTFEFKPAKSHRRTQRKNIQTTVKVGELSLTRRAYDIYEDHSLSRFGEPPSIQFLISNVLDICTNTYQIEYYADSTLFAVDYIDQTNKALSTIYCIFHSAFAHLSPGIFSILYAIQLAKDKNLPYLYLGYYVPGCKVMEYKISFHPYQWYCWQKAQWLDEPVQL